MKKLIALILALLMLGALCACATEDTMIDDPVINIGAQILTFTDADGNIYKYSYLTSTTIEIVGFEGITDEPHAITVPATYYDEETKTEYHIGAIGDEAFYANSSVRTIALPEGLTRIGAYAFANCEAMTAVTFPSTLETVDKGAFYGCDIIETYDFSKTALAAIGDNAFADSPALATVQFPGTLKTIGAAAFLNCTALTAITLPEGVETVETQAFYNCTAVESLTLPATLKNIGAWAFNPTARDLANAAISCPEGSVAAEYIASVRKNLTNLPSEVTPDEEPTDEVDTSANEPVVLPGVSLDD